MTWLPPLMRALARGALLVPETPAAIVLAKPNALQSLWGSGDVARDRARKNTAKSMISPPEGGEDRPQEIYTPQVVLDVVAEVWPGGIFLDPCSGAGSIVPALLRFNIVPQADALLVDGISVPWLNFTYANPPFKYLGDWLKKAMLEASLGLEIIVLCPVRTHRVWFRRAMKHCTAITYLDPLCFRGFAQAFPAPLCLFYWGKRRELFLHASRRVSKDSDDVTVGAAVDAASATAPA